MLDNIPAELRALPNWVLWRHEERNGNKTKVPYTTSGRHASVNDSNTWNTYERVSAILRTGICDGIGFCFTGSGFAGVDFDIDDSDSIKIVEWLDSYTERSPSGVGFHVIVKGSVPGGKHPNRPDLKIGIFSESRYFTMTGDMTGAPKPIREMDLKPLWEYLGGSSGPGVVTGGPKGIHLNPESDQAVITKASTAENSQKFLSLWAGELGHYNDDHSAADQALVNMLAFYTQDYEQIERLWKASGLARKKTYRTDYIQRTITRAMDQQIPLVNMENLKWTRSTDSSGFSFAPSPSMSSSTVALKSSALSLPFIEASEESEPLDFPPGLVGEIAQFIFGAAIYPVKEVAISGAIALLAGITGRCYNISGTGLNQYIILLALSGRGKEAAIQGINRLMAPVIAIEPGASAFIGPEYFASSQALMKSFAGPVPSFASLIGECGKWLQELCHERANPNNVAILKTILKLYSRSGESDVLQRGVYSDKEKNIAAVNAPAFTLFGECTPESFYEALDEQAVSSGLIPRFLTVEYLGDRPKRNELHFEAKPSPQLVDKLSQLCAMCLQFNQRSVTNKVYCDTFADSADSEFAQFCDDKINSEKSDVTVQIWNRANLKTLKLAALLAVGTNPMQPVVTTKEYYWAADLVMRGVNRLCDQFGTGATGNAANATRQAEEVRRIILHFFSPDFEKFIDGNRIKREARDAGYIPLYYINKTLRKNSAFYKARDCNGAIEFNLKSLCSEGFVTRSEVQLQNGVKSTFFHLNGY